MKYLKKILLLPLLFISSVTFSQLEPKLDVLGAIFGMPVVKAEYIINEDFGVEMSFNFRFGKPYLSDTYSKASKQYGGGFKIEPRYYMSSDYDGDGYYMGLYFRNQSLSYDTEDYDSEIGMDYTYTINNKFSSIGALIGYKYYFDSGITIDYAVGLGRFLSNSFKSTRHNLDEYDDYQSEEKFDYYFSFGLGYRFDWGAKEEENSDVDEF